MTDKAYLIKNMLMYQAELGAAVQRKYDHPALDLITQREAFFFLKERDTAYGGEFTHGQAWVKRMTKEGKLNPKRRGKSDNSPLMYSLWRNDRFVECGVYGDKRDIKRTTSIKEI